MNNSSINEFELIEIIKEQFKALVSPGTNGIGDDCAVIPITADRSFVVTTDMLVEDIHFLREKIKPEDLGKKSLAVNLSDIAAMGAKPIASFLSVSLPPKIEKEWINSFIAGYKELSVKYKIPLLGGDTTGSEDKMVINITVIGDVSNKYLKTRSGASCGDIICVNGFIGDSAAGLKLLFNDCGPDRLIEIHHSPYPYVDEGQWLGRMPVTSMMDVSDGIGSDIRHIMKASGVGAIIEMESLPLSCELIDVCKRFDWDRYSLAVSGGEDYVLLFTLKPEYYEEVSIQYKNYFGKPIYNIGTITNNCGNVTWLRNGIIQSSDYMGFRHF